MFARLENNIVVETLDLEVLPEFHPDLVWVLCPNSVQQGWVYDQEQGRFSDPLSVMPLSELKESLKSKISVLRDGRFSAGFLYEGQVFQIGTDAQKDMLSMQTQLILGNSSAYDGYWMDQDNSPKVMSEEELVTFFQAAFNFVKNLKGSAWRHKAQIDALTQRDDLINYDPETLWPS